MKEKRKLSLRSALRLLDPKVLRPNAAKAEREGRLPAFTEELIGLIEAFGEGYGKNLPGLSPIVKGPAETPKPTCKRCGTILGPEGSCLKCRVNASNPKVQKFFTRNCPIIIRSIPMGVSVKTPYHPDIVRRWKRLGGKWDLGEKVWIFPPPPTEIVQLQDSCREIFGWDGLTSPTIFWDLEIDLGKADECVERKAPNAIWLLGRSIISRYPSARLTKKPSLALGWGVSILSKPIFSPLDPGSSPSLTDLGKCEIGGSVRVSVVPDSLARPFPFLSIAVPWAKNMTPTTVTTIKGLIRPRSEDLNLTENESTRQKRLPGPIPKDLKGLLRPRERKQDEEIFKPICPEPSRLIGIFEEDS